MGDIYKAFKRALKAVYDPPVRGLTSKKARQRKKAQKKYDQKPIVAAIRSQAIHGSLFQKISHTDAELWAPVIIDYPYVAQQETQDE